MPAQPSAETVRRRRFEGGGIEFFRKDAVERKHAEFDGNGEPEREIDEPDLGGRMGRDHGLDGVPQELRR